MKKDVAIVYMVAGISSRFEGKIKQFAKVTQEHTLIEYSLNQALSAGFSKIIFIVGNRTEQPFKEKFGDNYQGIPIHYALQRYDETERDRPWGTTDALCSIAKVIDCPFVVCNGDDIYGENTFKTLYNHLQENDQLGAVVGYRLNDSIPEQGAVHRAIFNIDDQDYMTDLVETFNIERQKLHEQNLTLNTLCSMNIYALHPETLIHLKEILDRFKQENTSHRTAEALLPNDIASLVKTQKLLIKIYPNSNKWYGVTNPGDELEIQKQLMN